MMTLLDEVKALEEDPGIVAGTPETLRNILRLHPLVTRLRKAYDYGVLSDAEIREFVGRLLRENATGARFPYEIAFSVLAVAFESRYSPLAREYVRDLSRVRNGRFPLASRVAESCMQEQARATSNDTRSFPPLMPIELTWWTSATMPSRGLSNGNVTQMDFPTGTYAHS